MSMELSPRLELRPSAVLVASMRLLALSSMELEQEIDRELSESVALERVNDSACSGCGGVLTSRCPLCCERRATPQSGRSDAEELAPETPARRTDRDRLLDDVRAIVASEDRFVAQYLIWSFDDRGLLEEGTEEIARRLTLDHGRVSRVLASIRDVSPPGLGARTIVECLLLQLDRLLRDGERVPPACPTIVERHLEALARGHLAGIAKDLETTEAAVLEARDFIRANLRPYVSWDAPEGPGEVPEPSPPVLPDVVIRDDPSAPGVFEIEVVEATRLALRIDPMYETLTERLHESGRTILPLNAPAERGRASAAVGPALSAGEQQHVRSEVRRARFFLSRLEERWETLLRVTACVAERQRGFLQDGPASLQRLTRVEVAAALGLHESTVSRATANKFVMLPSGGVIRFGVFFDASLPAREELRHIIAGEERPLSDAELARRMGERGYCLARRTITKYRQRLQVLPGSLR
jgi:RNA polymerase sigma-54 factor